VRGALVSFVFVLGAWGSVQAQVPTAAVGAVAPHADARLLPASTHAPERARATHSAEADVGPLAREARQLTAALQARGRVSTPPPRLLERGDRLAIVLEPSALDDSTSSCTTVAALGTRNVGFVLHFSEEQGALLARAWPVASAAGFASITRCGATKSRLGQLTLGMRSPRGLIQLLILQSEDAPPPLTELLPSRDAGPSLPAPELGPRPRGAELGSRTKTLRDDNARRGAKTQTTRGVALDRKGQGSAVVQLDAGCHRLDFLAAAWGDTAPDLDARLSALQGGDELARDESESAQASLRICTGRAERYLATVSGGAPGSEVTFVQAEWELPRGLPLEWGALARAQMADALWRELPPRVKHAPIVTYLGVQGRTELWLETRPDACYLVGVAKMRGELARLMLDVEGAPGSGESHAPSGRSGTSLSFCANGQARVRLRVTGSGDSLAWLWAAWEFPELGVP